MHRNQQFTDTVLSERSFYAKAVIKYDVGLITHTVVVTMYVSVAT